MQPGDASQTQVHSQLQAQLQPHGTMQGYDPAAFFCEMLRSGQPQHPTLTLLLSRLSALPIDSLRRRSAAAERDLLERGITFTVYSDATAIDRILPFDLIPRVITPTEWKQIETGVVQRVRALNMFLHDVYHDRKILADKIVPAELVLNNAGYCQAMVGFDVPFNTYVHVCGIDIVRDETGAFRVLEDNARTPSGVAYVVENRHMSLRVMSDLMTNLRVRGVDEYGLRLHNAMAEIAPPGVDDPQVVVLSPGIFNAAYFEHVFLAREMGVPLVEGRDLCVDGGKVWMRTTCGLAQVHTIYRRINDDFLDPDAFDPGSTLGVRGLIEAWRRGAVAIANAVGTGVADDKAIYAYMPRIIRYYLSEEAILPNVETRICCEPDALAYTLDHLHELVVKPVAESGGYGLLVGPHASQAELEKFRSLLKAEPSNYISQPTLKLSVSPTLCDEGVRPRHIDLRPFAVTGKDTWVLPGGLTRVALRAGSLVVNSSQGGGSKDTWVLA
ncbi:circularly permuted type 2 ATP-grasp protein [Rhodopila sp.]|uniref:circularly permuted type 2 ATP-grasp protein n=1 Tax=Rhodopila sp. TaxID=2480087 RepID=UPI003D13CFD4